MSKKFFALLTAAVLTVTMLAGCGGSDAASSAPASAPASSPAASSAPAESAPASDLDYIKGKGEMIIGYTVYAPMNYTDENGEFVGFDTELAEAVCAELGVTPVFQEIVWDTKEVELAAGTIDCVWNGLTITDERKANMAITDPYVLNAQVVIMRDDNSYVDTSSLADANVCAEQGSAGETVIAEDANLSTATYIPKGVQTDCLMEVAAGTCDAAVLDITLAKAMIGEGTDYANLVIVDQLAEEYYGVAFRKGSDVCDATNDAFAALIDNGTMQALADKYSLTLAE